MRLEFYLFIIFCGYYNVYCQTTNTIATTTTIVQTPTATTQTFDLSVCICDLTKGICDLNCCCDKDCTTNDKAAFTICSDKQLATNIYNKSYCIPNNSIYKTNTPYILTAIGDLLCISLDNYDSFNYYVQPSTPTDAAVASLISNLDARENSNSQSALNFYTADIYKADIPIWLIFANNFIGYLSLPVQLNKNKCEQGSPVTYLSAKTSTCSYSSLTNVCTSTQTYLNLDSFLKVFKLLQNPNAIKTCLEAGTNTDYYTACSNYLIVYKCTKDGVSVGCSALSKTVTLDLANSKCLNVVKQIKYTLTYTNPVGIVQANIDVQLADVALADSFQQTFSVEFLPNRTVTDNVYAYSGNPGYIVGKPIVAGILTGTQINLSKSSDSWFTIPKSNAKGNCDVNSRATVNFGVNVATDCLISESIDVNFNVASCESLQNRIFDIILGTSGTRSNRVATLGNADTNNPGSWLEIIEQSKQNKPVSNANLKGVCDQMITSANILIAYANLGNIANPQAKILYVGYDWGSLQTVRYQCFGLACSTQALNLRISTKVTYLDVSQPPNYIESKIVVPYVRLPQDFFYPFTLSKANSMIYTSNITIFYSFVIAFCIYFL